MEGHYYPIKIIINIIIKIIITKRLKSVLSNVIVDDFRIVSFGKSMKNSITESFFIIMRYCLQRI